MEIEKRGEKWVLDTPTEWKQGVVRRGNRD